MLYDKHKLNLYYSIPYLRSLLHYPITRLKAYEELSISGRGPLVKTL